MTSEVRRYPWKTVLFLIAAATLTSPLVIPYSLGLGMIAPGPSPPAQSLTVTVLVTLPAAGDRRVLGVLADADGVTPEIGAPVRGQIEQPPDEQHWPLVRWHLEKQAR